MSAQAPSKPAPVPDAPRGGAAARRTRRGRLPRVDARYLQLAATFGVLIAMFVLGGLRYDNFVSGAIISNLFINNAFLIVIAVGMTFVILTGGIDLSVGAVAALSGVLAARLFEAGWPSPVVIPLVILVGTVIGTVSGLIIHYFDVQPFVATLAALFFARGLAFVVSLQSIPISNEVVVALSGTRLPLVGGFSVTPSVLIAALVVLLAFVVLHFTRFGRTVYAIGGSESSASLMGLPVARTKVLAYTISGTCAGLGGFLFAVFSRSGYSLTGVGLELDAIAAVVIGGTLLTGGSGFVLGSVIGVLELGLIQTIITFEGTLSSWWTRIVIGLLLLAFVVLQRVITARRG
ncbi:galactofuranose ABC transporter, permease protein YjfF [Aquipuribacter sp. SD81]|uniref:galactofuranose ABC transporter, permease protein YjfF n=1 Tax=Aquipuribacter sp. SD81 TaxID=3127703 RepID=UPI003018DA9A